MRLFGGKRPDSSEELLALLRGSEEEVNRAMRIIYKRNYQGLKNFILSRNGNKQDVDEILQRALLNFVEKVRDEKLLDIKNPVGYVFTICKNQWLNSKRYTNRQSDLSEEVIHAQVEEESNAHEQLELEEMKAAVAELLEKLGGKCKELLIWSLGEGIDMKTVAKSLAYQSTQAAMNGKSKCKKKLKELVSKQKGYQQLIHQVIYSD